MANDPCHNAWGGEANKPIRIKAMLYAKSKRWVKSCEMGAKGFDFVCKKIRLSDIISMNAPFFHSITSFLIKEGFPDSLRQPLF